MATRSIDIVGRRSRATNPADLAPKGFLRPRMVVAASSNAEAVRFAGGLMFDRVTAGWDVVVLTMKGGDPRPLQILGARPIDLEAALDYRFNGRRPQTIAIEAGLYDTDPRVRGRFARALEDADSEIRICGDRRTESAGPGAFRHRLSAAARAFKAQALVAAAASGADEVEEVFQSGDTFYHSKSA